GTTTREITRSLLGLALEKWPFFALTIGSSFVTLAAQKAGGSVVSLHHMPFTLRLANAFVSCAIYLMKLFWPVNLVIPYPFTFESQWPLAAGAAGLIVLA